jgi:hypothetical protein
MANQVAWEKRWAYCVLLGIGFGKKYPSLVAFLWNLNLQRPIFCILKVVWLGFVWLAFALFWSLS